MPFDGRTRALAFISRSQTPPLALDLLEVFRVPLVDMMVMASVPRSSGMYKPTLTFEECRSG